MLEANFQVQPGATFTADIVPCPGGAAWQYEYFLQDHLGNNRVLFADENGNNLIEAAEVLQENHYYPFGMEMRGGWLAEPGVEQRYGYNGKELNEEVGWYDYGARWYDAALGRWGQVDPLVEKFKSFSPFNYVLNNPIGLKDPDGRAPCPPGTPCDNPLPDMRVRQNQASNLGPGSVRNNGSKFHSGHDLFASTGTRVHSVMAGRVIATGTSSSYGNYITVQHTVVPQEEVVYSEIFETEAKGTTLYTFYAHLSEVGVKEGDEVITGEQIGLSGTTGNASGMTGDDEHLHFEVGTSLRKDGRNLNRSGLVDPNLVYNGVSFFSADPAGNQTSTGVIKISVNGVTYQPLRNPSGDQQQTGRGLLNIIYSILNNQ